MENSHTLVLWTVPPRHSLKKAPSNSIQASWEPQFIWTCKAILISVGNFSLIVDLWLCVMTAIRAGIVNALHAAIIIHIKDDLLCRVPHLLYQNCPSCSTDACVCCLVRFHTHRHMICTTQTDVCLGVNRPLVSSEAECALKSWTSQHLECIYCRLPKLEKKYGL